MTIWGPTKEDDKEVFEFFKQRRRERKKQMQQDAPNYVAKVEAAGLDLKQFTAMHYRVEGRSDYRPTTGKWFDRKRNRTHWGCDKLIKTAIAHKKEMEQASSKIPNRGNCGGYDG